MSSSHRDATHLGDGSLHSRSHKRPSQGSESTPALDTRTSSGQGWYDVYEFSINGEPVSKQKSHRRTTFQSSSLSEKQPVAIRKSRSLKEHSRSRLKSPPPLLKQSKSMVVDKLPSLPPVMKRSLSLKKRSANNENMKQIKETSEDPFMPVNRAFTEYQGYSRHKRERSFTYSPPPRTTSLTEISIPPLPKIPSLFKSRNNSLKKKSSSDLGHQSSSRPTSNISNISNVNFHHNSKNVSELQKELDRMLSDLPERNNKKEAIDMNKDLAQIEKDIQALALERHASFIKENVSTGRKRGKTLPGSLATPPPIPTLTLPPMTLNPLQMTIPSNLQKKRSQVLSSTNLTSSLRQSTSMTNKVKLSTLTLDESDIENIPLKRKSPTKTTTTTQLDVNVRRTASHQPTWTGSPHSVLKHYSSFLSDFEREGEEIQQYGDIYFIGPQAQKQHDAFDDERGDYKIVVHDHLAYRYEVLEVLGRGSFGQVVKCLDHRLKQIVAIKIIRNKKRFHAQGLTEIGILKKLSEWDPEDVSCTIKMTDYFTFRQHLCIAFDCLSMNLYEFIRNNHFQGFSLGMIKRMAYQILQALLLLAKHDVIHCDLKPENIMLKSPMKSSIKVIDFGSSCFESERVYTYIQSRFYRAPEIMLGISYHKAIDMWSLGCILAELYTGIPIFPGENEQEQLSCIMEVMGLPDKHMIEKSSRRKLFFDSKGNPRIVANSKGKKRIPCTKSLYQVLKCNDTAFFDFVERCLQWDPSKRMTPKEALQHEWLTSSRSNMPVNPISCSTPSPTTAYKSNY